MTLGKLPLLIEDLRASASPDQVIEIFDKALVEIGAEYHALLLLPLGNDIGDVILSWRVRPDWRAFYSEKKLFQRDPAIRHCRRSVMPFDWAASSYNQRTEYRWGEVMSWARDFNVDKGILVPVPSPAGVIGLVWGAGPHFDERRTYMPYLHVLGVNAFHRLQQLGAAVRRSDQLTARERDILRWVSKGKSAWQIACFFQVQQRIVEWQIEQACKKLGATDKFGAIAMLEAAEVAKASGSI